MTCYCVFRNRMKIDLMKTSRVTAFALARIDLNRRNWIASKAQRLTGLRKDHLEMEKKQPTILSFSAIVPTNITKLPLFAACGKYHPLRLLNLKGLCWPRLAPLFVQSQ